MDPTVFRAASDDSSFFENLSESESNTVQQETTIEKNTVLHVALRFKNFKAAESIVNSIPGLMYKTNSKDNTPLHVAARVGKSSMVKLLIDHAKKPDVEIGGSKQLLRMVNQDGDTALHVAVRYGNFDVVKELINENDPAELAKHVNNAGDSALFLAVDRELYDMASHILSAAPDNCSYAGRHGMNVLHALVIRTSSFTLRELRNYGQASGYIRFVISIFWVAKMVFRSYPITKSLGRELRNISARKLLAIIWGNFGTIPVTLWSPSMHVDSKGGCITREVAHLKALAFVGDVINKWPCIIEQADDSGWTPLHIAAQLGNDNIIKLILEKKKSIAYAKNKEGLSALHIAAMEGNFSVMKELITACPDIYEMLDNRGQTAIHAAAERGQYIPFQLLKKIPGFKGLMTLVSEQNEEGNTPFYLAAIKGHALSFRFMEFAECDNLNATNKEGFTTMDKLFLGRASFGEAWKKDRIKPFWKKGARPSLRGAMRIRNLDPTGKPEQPGIRNSDPRRKPEQAGDGDGDDDGDCDGDGDDAGRSVSDFVERVSETNLLVATLIATVTFTAAFTVPGGFNQNGIVGEGLAVLWKNTAFRVFLIANTLAFGLSTTSVFVHFLGSSAITGNVFLREVVQNSISFTNWSVGALLVAFISGTYAVVPHSWGITVAITLCCCFLFSLFFPLFIKIYY